MMNREYDEYVDDFGNTVCEDDLVVVMPDGREILADETTPYKVAEMCDFVVEVEDYMLDINKDLKIGEKCVVVRGTDGDDYYVGVEEMKKDGEFEWICDTYHFSKEEADGREWFDYLACYSDKI